MALITIDDVQSWFTDDRLSLDGGDKLPEETNVSAEVLATVSTRYDITTWVDDTTTPRLIRSVISARVAAIRYSKHYADQLDEIVYADWLNDWAMNILEGIVNGTIPLLDVPTDDLTAAQEAASAAFYPTDASSVDDQAAKFTMDMSF